MKSISAGIDVSKDRLDVLIERDHFKKGSYSNDLSGVGQIKEFLGEGNYVIAVEATGRYESLVVRELSAAGYTVRVKNPRQVRKLAQGLGHTAKTDGIDAKMLAETAQLGPQTTPRSLEREALGDISRTIQTLKKDRTNHLKRIKVPGVNPIAIEALKAVVKAIEAQVTLLRRKFVELVRKSSFATRYALLLTIPGVGPCLARIAVCELPEDLHRWSVRQLSSYAGVATMDNSSGNKRSPAHVPTHGNSHLKAGLYMPAISLLATQDWAKKTYSRLLAKGKLHQQAMIAIMHKLFFHLVAVLKRGSAWKANPLKT
jgi:transposase